MNALLKLAGVVVLIAAAIGFVITVADSTACVQGLIH